MINAVDIREFRKNKLMKMNKDEKELGFSKFLEEAKKMNLDTESELENLREIRGINN